MKEYEVYMTGYFIQTDFVTAKDEEEAKNNALSKLGLDDFSNINMDIKEVKDEEELNLYIEKKDKDTKVYEVNITGNFTQSEYVSAENEESAKIDALSTLDLEDFSNLAIDVIEIEEEN